ncbi:MAG: hypothetical protein EPO35_11630 [Acidobacteria bacterium]|nr:MAG: hypothetical protein EPO35_11630 [Acidobacteriota bacterium]
MRAALVLALVLAVSGSASAEPVTVVRNNGPATNRLNMVIMGDGYTAGGLSQFARDVDSVLAALFRDPPYSEYANYFNVLRVDVTSTEVGVSHPEVGRNIASALGAYYNCGGIQRLICINTSAVNAVLARSVPANQRDLVLVLVNDTEYGGSGGSIAVASTNFQSSELVLHEYGHTLGLLADEYTTQPPTCFNSVEPAEVNATRETSRSSIKWSAWIDAATPIPTTGNGAGIPGLYEGAKYCPAGLYRPTNDSKMRSLGRPFEQINSEQLILRYYNFVSPIDAVTPSETTLSRVCGERVSFLVEALRPRTHDLTIRWRVDGVVVSSAAALTLDTAGYRVGNHTVDVTVSDPTSAVRRDPALVLQDGRQWTLTVRAPASQGILGFPERGCGAAPLDPARH